MKKHRNARVHVNFWWKTCFSCHFIAGPFSPVI